MSFGYGTKFPAKYQKALYLLDWTFGTIYALHLEPDGSTYKAVKEEFLSRTPLPLTDVAVGPDGALYFTVGGRGAQSELFRVTYVGKESTSAADLRDAARRRAAGPAPPDRKVSRKPRRTRRRRSISSIRILDTPTVSSAMPPASPWSTRNPSSGKSASSAEKDPETLITGAVALRPPGRQVAAIAGSSRHSTVSITSALTEFQQLELLRVYQLAFIRMGEPDAPTAARWRRSSTPSIRPKPSR